MEYRGRVKDGVVVFTETSPPEGSDVRVLVSEAADQPSIWQKLKKYSGVVRGLPKDMARNHDHYIHGGPLVRTRAGL
jgi:hypothetical protein